MNYYIELQTTGGALVYTNATKKDGVTYSTKVGASPEEAVRRLLVEDMLKKQVVIRSVDNERLGVWYVNYDAKRVQYDGGLVIVFSYGK